MIDSFMTIINKASVQIFLISLGLFLLTPLSIYIVYGDKFTVFRWLEFSLITTNFTWISALASSHSKETSLDIWAIFYGLLFVPFLWLIYYPGLRQLEIFSDSRGLYAMSLIAVLHGIGFYSVGRVFIGKKTSNDQQTP